MPIVLLFSALTETALAANNVMLDQMKKKTGPDLVPAPRGCPLLLLPVGQFT